MSDIAQHGPDVRVATVPSHAGGSPAWTRSDLGSPGGAIRLSTGLFSSVSTS